MSETREHIDGYFDKVNGVLNIYVSNIDEFNNLLIQAQKEACQLKETMDRLSTFAMQILFSTGKEQQITPQVDVEQLKTAFRNAIEECPTQANLPDLKSQKQSEWTTW